MSLILLMKDIIHDSIYMNDIKIIDKNIILMIVTNDDIVNSR